MNFLNGLTIGFLVFQLVIIIVANLRRRRIPFTADVLAFLSIIVAVINAIMNMTLWPLGTVVLQILMLVVLVWLDKWWDRKEMAERNREWDAMRRDLEIEEEIRGSHINRTYDDQVEDK